MHLRVDPGLWLALEEFRAREALPSASAAAECALLRALRERAAPALEAHPKVRGLAPELGVRTAWFLVPEVSRYAQRFAHLTSEGAVIRGLVRAVVQGGSQERGPGVTRTRVLDGSHPGSAQDALEDEETSGR